jgi:ABC transporter substrate binding protein
MKARGPVRYRVEKATAVIAAKQATSIIPIVFAIAADPIGTGLVASLARPGGNVTGLSIQSTDVAAKRLALLREVVPSLRRLAIVANFGNPASALESGEVQTAARGYHTCLRGDRGARGCSLCSHPDAAGLVYFNSPAVSDTISRF